MKIKVTDQETSKEVDIYTEEGLQVMTELWERTCFHHRLMYEPTWLGVPIIQIPEDIVMVQELLWKLRPDVVLETGVAHGGSLMLSASILELIGKGRVIGVDIEIRKYNEIAINSHPLSKRISLLQGSSIDPETIKTLKSDIKDDEKVMVVLDSNHSYDHVLKELELYSQLISPGGYMIVMDGIQGMLATNPAGKPEWGEDNPLRAIHDFLKKNSNWEIDPTYTRLRATCCPDGFLKRIL